MTPAPPPDPAPPGGATPEPRPALAPPDLLVSELEAMRKGGDRLWLVSWDGHAYTLRPVGQIRRRVVVDPP